MTDVKWNTDADAPVVPQQENAQDPRLVKARPERKTPFDFGPGENRVFILPSCSNYEEVLAKGEKYQWGWPYVMIKIQAEGDKFGQELRVPNSNPLTRAFFELYRAWGYGPKLKAVKDAGFQAGPDYRYLFNAVLMSEDNQLSPIKFIRAGMKNPYKQDKDDAKPKLRELLVGGLVDGSNKIKARTGTQVFPASPKTAVLLSVQIVFNGTFPQYTSVLPARDEADNVIAADISDSIPEYTPEKLDEARVWAETLDPLPELNQIPALYQNGEACEILKISAERAGATRVQVSGVQAPELETPQPPAAGNGAHAVVQSLLSIPKGFGKPVVASAPASSPVVESKPEIKSAIKPLAAPVFASQSAKAAEDFAKQLEMERAKVTP